jgi:hypothetical protein
MFIWNMLGALILLPALAHFLLGANTLPENRQTKDEAWRGVAKTSV